MTAVCLGQRLPLAGWVWRPAKPFLRATENDFRVAEAAPERVSDYSPHHLPGGKVKMRPVTFFADDKDCGSP